MREDLNQRTVEKIRKLLGDTIEFSQKTIMMSKRDHSNEALQGETIRNVIQNDGIRKGEQSVMTP